MIQFLVGLAAASLLQSEKRLVGRSLAGLIVKTEDAAKYVAQEIHRLSARISEDYQDLVAEARAEHDSQKQGES